MCVSVGVYVDMQSRYSVVPGPSPGRPEAPRLSSPPTTTTRTTLTNQLPDRTTAIPTTLVRLIPSFSPEVLHGDLRSHLISLSVCLQRSATHTLLAPCQLIVSRPST